MCRDPHPRHARVFFATGFVLPTPQRMSISARVCLVVPCYNEMHRFEDAPWHKLVRCGLVHLIFVDDGSSDHTSLRLANLVRTLPRNRASALILPQHVGRGEAVRQGLLEALMLGHAWVGYTDADTATPVPELLRLIRDVLPSAPDVVLGARVRRLGAQVQRRPRRLLLGRLFAWGAGLALACDVYDTQCPAKFFRPSQALRHALHQPFTASWIFDTELIARLLYPAPGKVGLALNDFLEVPLQAWRDVGGSKLTWRAGVRAGADLLRIAWRLRHAPAGGMHRRHAVCRAPGAPTASPIRWGKCPCDALTRPEGMTTHYRVMRLPLKITYLAPRLSRKFNLMPTDASPSDQPPKSSDPVRLIRRLRDEMRAQAHQARKEAKLRLMSMEGRLEHPERGAGR